MATWFAQTFLPVGLGSMIELPLARCNPHAGNAAWGGVLRKPEREQGLPNTGAPLPTVHNQMQECAHCSPVGCWWGFS
ncbi:hypothetical protein QBC36DRAFT_341333 [Triangularia setosa]|uniref:Uncharacterized protein n=1 Tax=Triangularia setosa TaxID=2587417 RepID=A0AAN6VWM0_9PEZI|nr:hypothetical protein QBC36DRAFT_341333 [Podospora setosa]